MRIFLKSAVVAALVITGGSNYASDILEAISSVESNKNDMAIGDNGKAVGRYQIHKCYVDDVNRIYKTSFRYSDRSDPAKSKQIVELYLAFYSKRYTLLTGYSANAAVLARIHNGGPNGYKNPSTVKYWQKVKIELLKEKRKNN